MPLTIKHLTTQLKIDRTIKTVISDLSFQLSKGKTLALVGESGCGKSMTALSILRILPTPPALPSQGEILFKGNNLLSLSESEMQKIRGKEIAMIFQDPMSALNPVYTIGMQLKEVAATHLKLSDESARNLALQALHDVHLPNPENLMSAYPHQLSGGMLQRVMIAMALICSPEILIADEPTTALDVTIQSQILSLLKELQQKKGMATLLITHDMGVVAEIADEVLVMYAGEQVERAAVETLFDNPAHPYTKALFESRMSVQKKKGNLVTIPGSVPQIGALPMGCRFHPRCRYAMKICQSNPVPLFTLSEEGHQARCWLHDQKVKQSIEDSRSQELKKILPRKQ